MLDKDIRFLERTELLELIEKQQKENQRLRQKLTKTKYELKMCRIEARFRAKKRLETKWYNPTFILIVTAVVAMLAAVWFLPVLRIYGTSMSPTLREGDFVVSAKGSTFDAGDVIAFYYNNNVLIKRVIAQAGDWVDIDEDGTVYVNHQALDEPYVAEKALGDCNIELPYQVPESRIFVMGDYREGSVDSRNTTLGCVAEEQIVGKVIFRAWPLSKFGAVR